jgi:hypothetical protein
MNSISGRPVDVRTTKVILLENDDVVASTTTDNYGVFEFQQVPDGSYGLAAVGVDGVGLIAINVGTGGSGVQNDDEFGVEPSDGDIIDFTMISSEAVGWLNHYAAEVAYRRELLRPRPPEPPANDYAAIGMGPARNAYLESYCRSRGLTFAQWQMNCQGQVNNAQFGEGQLIGKFADAIRDGAERTDRIFERAFLGEAYGGTGGNYGNANGGGYQSPNAGQFGQPAYNGGGYGGYQAPAYQAPVYQAPAYQAPTYQIPTPATLPPIIQGGM